MMRVEDRVERRRLERAHVSVNVHMHASVWSVFECRGKQCERRGGERCGKTRVAWRQSICRGQSASSVPYRIAAVARRGIGSGQPVMGRVLPVPIRKAEVHVANQLPEN